ncbi:hypothetical protein Taro_027957 [Colocasia esculenta]|uniref:Uncharacterized protein n=1 Tax=Colocasia esculenta TaxID=4460 RepID=A0A843VA16_COLES|nr:hypothetical protein [Colocasia esculenta]
MEVVTPGAVGTAGSLSLRLGQALFSTAALLFMSVGVEFYSYTAFCVSCLAFRHGGSFTDVPSYAYYSSQLSSDNYGFADSMEFHTGDSRYVLCYQRMSSSSTGHHGDCSCWGLDSVNALTCSCLYHCKYRRFSTPSSQSLLST